MVGLPSLLSYGFEAFDLFFRLPPDFIGCVICRHGPVTWPDWPYPGSTTNKAAKWIKLENISIRGGNRERRKPSPSKHTIDIKQFKVYAWTPRRKPQTPTLVVKRRSAYKSLSCEWGLTAVLSQKKVSACGICHRRYVQKESKTKVSTCCAGETEDIAIEAAIYQGSAVSSKDQGFHRGDQRRDIMSYVAVHSRWSRRLEKWRQILEDAGLKLSRRQIMYHLLIAKLNQDWKITTATQAELPRTPSFKQLGTTNHLDGRGRVDVEKRIGQAWARWRES